MNIRLVILSLVFLLLPGCSDGYTGSGAGYSAITPETQRALAELGGTNSPWLDGINDVVQLDVPPPDGVKFAEVKCDSGRVFFYNTTKERDVSFLKRLLIHEAYHVQNACKEWEDAAASAMARCYSEGGTYDGCRAQVLREYY